MSPGSAFNRSRRVYYYSFSEEGLWGSLQAFWGHLFSPPKQTKVHYLGSFLRDHRLCLLRASAGLVKSCLVGLAIAGSVGVTLATPLMIAGQARIDLHSEDQPGILDDDTPAHRAARQFMRGVNLGNVFEAAVGQDWGGGPILAEDLDAIREQGFDHVRIPVRWNAHTGPSPDYAISNAILTQVDSVVIGALERGMNARINLHHFEAFYEEPALWTNKLYAIWDQLAACFEGYPAGMKDSQFLPVD